MGSGFGFVGDPFDWRKRLCSRGIESQPGELGYFPGSRVGTIISLGNGKRCCGS